MNLNSFGAANDPPLGMAITTNPGAVTAIAARLIRTRKALGLNQRQLCMLAGIATNTYNQWERAVGRPDIDEAAKLCNTFGVTLDWIYRGDASGLSGELRVKMADQEGPTLDPPTPTADEPAGRAAKRGRR